MVRMLLEEVDGSGNVLARYIQGTGIDEPLAETRGSTTSYYEADGLGSVTSLSNSSAALANTYTYDSYGQLTGSSGTVVNPYRYTGRESDPETGIYYYRARYYSAGIGRFLNEDPVRFHGGIDFYAYVENDPIGLTDPFGLCPWQVQKRPLKGIAGTIPGTYHVYFYNAKLVYQSA
jgi:RHS repeat-associated protein